MVVLAFKNGIVVATFFILVLVTFMSLSVHFCLKKKIPVSKEILNKVKVTPDTEDLSDLIEFAKEHNL